MMIIAGEADLSTLSEHDRGEVRSHIQKLVEAQRRRERIEAALRTVAKVLERVPPGEPLEPGQVEFLREKVAEALG